MILRHVRRRQGRGLSVIVLGMVTPEYDISDIVSETRMVIQETDLDVFGHVNNAAYLRLFENARWDIIHKAGLTLKSIVEKQVGPVILGVEIKFMKELRAREVITIKTQATGYRRLIGTMTQEMRGESGVQHCQASFTFGIFDTKNRKLIPPPPEWLMALGIRLRA